ncbi:MAG TPA: low molecular weight protein-tyrosine-phosphatase [Saprospiraceae bacterium]|nr:low molecular weight protein-tyrosine-phosphatase [Saprospiraceae bacterium]
MKLLMVCLGNICRSPLAEGIMKERIKEQGLDWEVDSAGTGAYHTGELPDPRSIAMARENGIDITDQRARKITAADLDEFDLILTMDHSNQRNVLALTRNEQQREKVKSILDFAEANKQDEVPDPYWDDNGFQLVFDLLDQATEGIIKKLA